jgi:hypothetical protein
LHYSHPAESINLDVDENISKKKFFDLNHYEVQNEQTSEVDLWNGLHAVGFNKALEIDMVRFVDRALPIAATHSVDVSIRFDRPCR